MAFSKIGKVEKFDRNESVQIHVRELTLLPDTDDAKHYIEIREFIKTSSLYGHGVVLPKGLAREIATTITGLVADDEA